MTYTREYHRGAIHALNEVLAGRLVYYIIDDLRRHHCLALAAMPDEPPAPDWELVEELKTVIESFCSGVTGGVPTHIHRQNLYNKGYAALAMIEQRKAGR